MTERITGGDTLSKPSSFCEATARREFEDYLERASHAPASRQMGVLSYDDFCAVLARWEYEYHPAWVGNDTARMAELERALMLDV